MDKMVWSVILIFTNRVDYRKYAERNLSINTYMVGRTLSNLLDCIILLAFCDLAFLHKIDSVNRSVVIAANTLFP